MIRVAINGAAGRMGRRLVDLVCHEKDMRVVAALEQAGHSDLGRDIGELAGCGRLGITRECAWQGIFLRKKSASRGDRWNFH